MGGGGGGGGVGGVEGTLTTTLPCLRELLSGVESHIINKSNYQRSLSTSNYCNKAEITSLTSLLSELNALPIYT